MLTDISFQHYRKNEDIHGSVLYPATMIAPVQSLVIQELLNKKNIQSIFDPFHGSGTALYEALAISDNLDVYGCDINPLANLISRAKLQGVNNNIVNDIDSLRTNINNTKDYNFSFNNIDKWFRKDIAQSLRIIRKSIINITDQQNRIYFWTIFSDLIRRYSNTRSSTYKLHIRKPEDIKKIKNNLKETFIKRVEDNISLYSKNYKSYTLYKKDILDLLPTIKKDYFDLSITSPPYGDNATTVTYGQFSSLALNWIDKHDLVLDGWELNNYSIIDRKSLGGQRRSEKMNEKELNIILPYLNKISLDKQDKVINFFTDYFAFLKELVRTTKKYIVLTLGNRTVDYVSINLTEASIKYLELHGFKNQSILDREIPIKRTPKILSHANNKKLYSMNKEYVIIHKKTI